MTDLTFSSIEKNIIAARSNDENNLRKQYSSAADPAILNKIVEEIKSAF